jgi:hypothetical protein
MTAVHLVDTSTKYGGYNVDPKTQGQSKRKQETNLAWEKVREGFLKKANLGLRPEG